MDKFMLLALDPGDLTIMLSIIAIVFAALIIFVVIFWLFGKVFGGKKKAVKKDKVIVTAVQSTPKKAPVPVAPASADTDEETVAVITAAIMAFSGSGNFTIRKITRANQVGRPVWAHAGIVENTRPF